MRVTGCCAETNYATPADARLIAAAPELVDLLRAIVKTGTGPKVSSAEWTNVKLMRRAVLARLVEARPVVATSNSGPSRVAR